MMNLDRFKEFEAFAKKENIIGKKIQLIEKIENWKPKYSRQKWNISELEYYFWNMVKFRVSVKWSATTIDLTLAMATLIDKDMVTDKITACKFLSNYLAGVINDWKRVNVDVLEFISNLLNKNITDFKQKIWD